MSLGIAYNPCKNCKEMDKCSFCELTYFREGYIKSPTADVVEVVRCKYCKYFTIDEGDSLGYCTCQNIPLNFVGELYPTEDFYCSYGKRREG